MASKKASLVLDDKDRISNLPDGVLCHILSFLPTKYSVRTRVLSTRWQHLYTFVPNLDFDYHSFSCPLDSPSRNSHCRSFLEFVNSVFILYNVSRMNKLRFHFSNYRYSGDHCLTVPWITAAINRHVREIEISIHVSVPLMLPRELFSCKTLTKLSLGAEFSIVLPRSASLPCLLTCHFHGACFDHDSANRFFQICPVLECLRLTGCDVLEGVEVLNISVPTLKRLTLYENGHDYQYFFNLPNLLYFEYMGPAEYKFFGLESLKSLVNFCICYEPDIDYRDDSVIADLVRAIYHVCTLHLSCKAMEAFVYSGESLPKFKNLTHLSFGPISSPSSSLLPDLLDNSPKLQFLSFYQGYIDENNGNDDIDFVLPEHVSPCVSLHLKEVEFKFTTGLDYDHQLIKYFLKHARNLDKMVIRSNKIWNEQFDISSTTCQIVYHLVNAEGRYLSGPES